MTSPGVGSPAQRLGRYHLTEPLGGGPTGEVFRAKVYGVAGFDRQFAVKRFHAEFVDDPDTAAAISAAARTYGSLEHPRIARLQEYGVTGGYTFTATELVQGLDLARLLSVSQPLGKSLPAGAAAALISQAARTVGYAHGRGICHLGLCPTNLIATPDGEVKITDFGFLPARLPKRPAEDPSLRVRLPYLAPEQVAAEATSAATDVFQLGAIAYELFTGKPAFTGPTPQEIAKKILSSQPPLPDLPKPLLKVLQRCLARSPFERYPDARALADALDAAVRGAPLAGSIHDVSTAVRAAMQHLDTLDDQVSGAVSFPVPAPPRPQPKRADGDDRAPQTTVRMPHLRPSSGPMSIPPIPPVGSSPPSFDDGEDDKTNPVTVPAVPLAPSPLNQTLRGVGTGNLRPVRLPPLEGAEPDDEIYSEIDDEMPTRVRERDKGFVSVPGELRRTTGPIPLPTVSKPADEGSSAARGGEPATAAVAGSPKKPDGKAEGQAEGKAGDQARDELSEPAIELVFEDELSPSPAVPVPAVPARSGASGRMPAVPAMPARSGASGRMPAVPAVPARSGASGRMPAVPAVPARSGVSGPMPAVQANAGASEPPALAPRLAARTPEAVSPSDVPAPEAARSDTALPQAAAVPSIPAGMRKRASAPADLSSPRVHMADSWDPLTPVPSDGRAVDRSSRSRRSGKPAAGSPSRSGRATQPDQGSPKIESKIEPENQSKIEPENEPGTQQRGSAWKWAALVVVLVALGGGGGYMAYDRFIAGTRVAAPGADSGADAQAVSAVIGDAGTAMRAIDAGAPDDASAVVAAAHPDAASDEPVDTGSAEPTSTRLIIRSRPKQAKVYIDGSSQGKTPITLDATSDRHRLAVVLPGYKLYIAEINGSGTVEATLDEVAPPEGPAGIKVRCSKKNRYYVFLDGVATGQLCPTERLGVDVGEHVVEIYDPITDSRREFPVTVNDTRRSVRIRVD
jgi:eukaryotic-like serine/threonine-protein kinase